MVVHASFFSQCFLAARRFILLGFLPAILTGHPLATHAGELEQLASNQELWTMSRSEFSRAYGELGFRWTSADKVTCRAAGEHSLIDGVPAEEILVRFKNGSVDAARISVYNRGDAGDIPEKKFNAIGTRLTEWLAQRAQSRGRKIDGLRARGIRRAGKKWRDKAMLYKLEWAVSTVAGNKHNRPEYIRLDILPYASAGGTLGDREDRPNPLELRMNVVQRENGDRVIESVPMVDQGRKGYCAVAVMERVLRYLGRSADQHELAQIAGTQTGGGTDPQSLRKALGRFAGHFDIHVNPVHEFDIDELKKLVRNYNRVAKRADKTEIDLPTQGTINLSAIYTAMRPELLIEARERDRANKARFSDAIERGLRKGVPLVWSVMLGLVPEPGIPQARGGHMRLIIGFNKNKKELIYSDTWGRGHEEKRMDLSKAWAITTNLYRIKPL